MIVSSPLPEEVHLLPENFLYWIKLEYPNLAEPDGWIQAKPSVVLPLLEKSTFDETGFRINEERARSLFNIPSILRTPNCIHRNLRNQEARGQGGIKGDHLYVICHGSYTRKVAFTRYDIDLKKVILITSFGASKEWVDRCVEMPALHIRNGCTCACK